MASILERENELFNEWRPLRRHFVADGLPNEDAYLTSAVRLLFVLKEVNDPHHGGWDLRQFLREGGKPRTWNNISRWIHGIRNLDTIPSWPFYKDITLKFRVDNLQSICAINLNKSPGGQTAKHGTLREVVQQDCDLIRKQLSFYDPDITICCGTGGLLYRVVSEEANKPKWELTTRGIWHFEWPKGKHVISFAHPEARVQYSILFYALMDAIDEISHNKPMQPTR
jgi:hypothetical protein